MVPEEKMKEILDKHGIELSTGGCGCCGSPWVSFAYKGEKIIDDREEFGFNNFKEGK